MAVKMRLRRMGAKKQPYYRIVAIDSKKARGGNYLENLGTYNPSVNPPAFTLKEESILSWMKKGAQPTQTVMDILRKAGITARFAADRS